MNLIHVNSIGIDDEEGGSPQRIGKEELKKAQEEDKVIGQVYKLVELGQKVTPKDIKGMGQETKVLLRQFKKLMIEDGVMKRQTSNFKQIVSLKDENTQLPFVP